MQPLLFILLFFCKSVVYSQYNDSLPYTMFKDKIVAFTDVGFNAAPFSLLDNYGLGVKKLQFKHNIRATLGFGFAYKWFALRIGFALPGNLKSESRFGNTEYFDLGLKFNIKQVYTNINLRNYKGYVLKDEYKWNDSLNSLTPNGFYPNLTSTNISANVWWFRSKEFNMNPVLGRVGHYDGPAKTWYFKTSLNFFGISSSGNIVSPLLSDTTDRANASTIGAIDLGVIPGYAYVNRVNNWQFALFGGLGGVIQSKFYTTHGKTRSFLGIAPRVDLRLLGGYSKPSYFVLLTTDFDFKSVTIKDLKYNQTYYTIKLVAGIRIKTKSSKRKHSD